MKIIKQIKYVLVATAVIFIAFSFSSCKNTEKCPAYGSLELNKTQSEIPATLIIDNEQG